MEIILFSIPLIFRLIYDWDKIRKQKETISTTGYFKRNLALLAQFIAVGLIAHWLWPEPPLIVNFTYPLGIFLLCFDYSINLLSGKPFFYRSETGKSRWEVLRSKTPIVCEILVRLWVSAVLISVYYQYNLL